MWWAQSLSDQAFWYADFKKTSHTFKGRTLAEAEKKMKKFMNEAQITGRFACVEEGFEPKPVDTRSQKEPVNRDGKKKGKYIRPPNHPWRRHNPALYQGWHLD